MMIEQHALYTMEELIPIVAKLAEKYTAFESSSVSYETAKQLMEAVLYAIHELGMPSGEATSLANHLSAEEAYELGASRVAEKTKEALTLFHTIQENFDAYDNRCLEDTFLKGMPEFFKWYDHKFEPQNTILTLDYPILVDLSQYNGIDRIYSYLLCLEVEQEFLHGFPRAFVIEALKSYHRKYQDLVENLSEIVLTHVISHFLCQTPLQELFAKYPEKQEQMMEYFQGTIHQILTRLQLTCE